MYLSLSLSLSAQHTVMWFEFCMSAYVRTSEQISCLILQVVPTIYTDIRGRTVHSNQVLLES